MKKEPFEKNKSQKKMSKKPVLVRLKKGKKQQYEILVNHGTVEKYRQGKLGWNKVAYVDQVFKNSSKGDRATTSELKKDFGTDNTEECMQIIAKKGELQLTSSDRKQKLEEKRKQISNHIHKYYMDPKTGKSHPLVRIENAMEKTKVRVDMDKPIDKQIQEIVRKLPEFLPIRKSIMEITVTIPNSFVGKAMGILTKSSATIASQNYTAKGCKVALSIVPGDYDKIVKDLGSATKGECTIDVAGKTGSSSSGSDGTDKDKRGKKKKKGRR